MGVGSQGKVGRGEEEVSFDYARERWRKKKTVKGEKEKRIYCKAGVGKNARKGGEVEGLLCSLSRRKRKERC